MLQCSLTLLLLSSISAVAQVTPCGDQLDSAIYQGVVARSNGQFQGKAKSCGGRGSYGLQYQCVEYIRRFYGDALGVNTKSPSPWASLNAVDFFDNAARLGLTAYGNGESMIPPASGDILVFNSTTTNPYGHVAIVTDVSATTVSIIEQNWSRTGTASLGLVKQNGIYIINRRGNYEVLGWLKPSFDFAMGLFAVDGNIFGSGSPDGLFDFFDNFNDGSLTTPPTSYFYFPQPMVESGGFLRFRSADGANLTYRFGGQVLEDDAILNYPLGDGYGNSEILAIFRADNPGYGQFYGIGIVNAGYQLLESVAIWVGKSADGRVWVTVNDHTGTFIAADPVTLPSNGFIIFKLFVNDALNQVYASYSIDNGITHKSDTAFAYFSRHGTVFNATPWMYIFAQGGVLF